MQFPVKRVIVLHEFFTDICIVMAYSEKYTCKANHNLHNLTHVYLFIYFLFNSLI